MSDSGNGDFEFERKFYLHDVPSVATTDPNPTLIVQAYLFASDGYAVRVRVEGSAPTDVEDPVEALLDALGESALGTITTKGPAVAATRYEAERELDPCVASQIVRRAANVIVKVRYSTWLGEDGWVVDKFLGVNAPLVVAEVERGGPVVDLAVPEFCVTEVSEDDRFRNENLAFEPFGQWREAYQRELALVGPKFMHSLGDNRIAGF